MRDNTNAATFQGGGQPLTQPAAPAAPGQPEGGSAAQPQYVTLDEAQRIATDAAEEAFRRAQSLYSKGQAGFEKKVQADLRNLEKALELQKKAGVTVTPEQENHMRQQVINQAFMDGDQPTQPAAPGAQPAQAGEGAEDIDPVTADAWRLMDEAGVTIEDDDPEVALLNQGSPYVFLKSIEAAIAAKRQRLGNTPQPQAQPPRTPTNAGSGGSVGKQPADLKNLDAMWSDVVSAGKI